MSTNLTMFIIAIAALIVGAAAGLEINYLTQKGKNPKTVLDTADVVLDGVKTANGVVGELLPAPVESIINKVLQTAQAGVHAAQQLCDSNQLTEDQRKQKAFDFAMNLLKLEGYEPTAELEAAVKDAIETGVRVAKIATNQVTPIVTNITPVATVSDTESSATPEVSTITTPTVTTIDDITKSIDQRTEEYKQQLLQKAAQTVQLATETAQVTQTTDAATQAQTAAQVTA